MSFLSSYNDTVNNALRPLDAPAVAGFLKMAIVLYAGLAAPHLPASVLKYFNLVPVRILILFLIVWTGNHDPALSITIAVAFFVTMNILAGKQAFEAFHDRQYYDNE